MLALFRLPSPVSPSPSLSPSLSLPFSFKREFNVSVSSSHLTLHPYSHHIIPMRILTERERHFSFSSSALKFDPPSQSYKYKTMPRGLSKSMLSIAMATITLFALESSSSSSDIYGNQKNNIFCDRDHGASVSPSPSPSPSPSSILSDSLSILQSSLSSVNTKTLIDKSITFSSPSLSSLSIPIPIPTLTVTPHPSLTHSQSQSQNYVHQTYLASDSSLSSSTSPSTFSSSSSSSPSPSPSFSPSSPLNFSFGPHGDYDQIVLISVGKASVPMANSMCSLIPKGILKEGIVVTPETDSGTYMDMEELDNPLPPSSLCVLKSSHPLPSSQSIYCAQRVMELLDKHSDNGRNLFILLLSGGSSSLLSSPPPSVSLDTLKSINSTLLSSGCDIHEMNTIRKHFSTISGGRLGQRRGKSALLSLILSDTVGDEISSIGSGPTAIDNSTFIDCFHVINKYKLEKTFPREGLNYLLRGVKEGEKGNKETVKTFYPPNSSIYNVVIGSNKIALAAAAERAKDLGYFPLILTDRMVGEAKEAAKFLISVGRTVGQTHSHPTPSPCCVLVGGETTVTLNEKNGTKGNGMGGRNTEMVLSAAIELDKTNPMGNPMGNISFLSVGTDGIDGNSPSSGAMVTNSTLFTLKSLGCSGAVGKGEHSNQGDEAEKALREHNSYGYFRQMDRCAERKGKGTPPTLISLGQTGTNVMDLQILLITEDKQSQGEGERQDTYT